jgi:glucosamine-6-phosphate deaminase
MVNTFQAGNLTVEIYENRQALGRAVAEKVSAEMIRCIEVQGSVRIVFAAAPSQNDFLEALAAAPGIGWKKVTAFTQDEYLGTNPEAESSLFAYIKTRFFIKVKPGIVHAINGAALDVAAECARYGNLITEKSLDIVCVGIGDNGHIAFNEPHEADFNDPQLVKVITVDEKCKDQQVNNFGFNTKDTVPPQGYTLTIPALMSGKRIFCTVPTQRKAAAARDAIRGPVSEVCPASVLRRHGNAAMFLDADSASLL